MDRVELENMHLLKKITGMKSSVPTANESETEFKSRQSRLKMISKTKMIESNAHLLASPSSKSIALTNRKRSTSRAHDDDRLRSATLKKDASAVSIITEAQAKNLHEIIKKLAQDSIEVNEQKPKKTSRKKRNVAQTGAQTERVPVESTIEQEAPTDIVVHSEPLKDMEDIKQEEPAAKIPEQVQEEPKRTRKVRIKRKRKQLSPIFSFDERYNAERCKRILQYCYTPMSTEPKQPFK